MANATKHLLADSLKDMLAIKTIDKITVKEICENCNVNRQTFYYNFRDIYDLVEWILDDDLENRVDNKTTYETWRLGIHAVFDYARENQYFVLNAFHSSSLPALGRYLKSRCKPIILKMIEDRNCGQNLSEENKDFVADFYSAQIVNIVCEWIESGMSIKYEEKLRKTEQLIAGSMDYVIKKVANSI